MLPATAPGWRRRDRLALQPEAVDRYTGLRMARPHVVTAVTLTMRRSVYSICVVPGSLAL
jgi:hypothetical protein